MKFSDCLQERTNSKVILVDFQPAYEGGHQQYLTAQDNAINYLNKYHPNQCLIFYNGEEVGIEDSLQDVKDYYLEWGLDPTYLPRIDFQEKGYGFLRNWMGQVDDSTIIEVVRYMVMNRLRDSREIENEVYSKFDGAPEEREDVIYIPDISLAKLKQYNGALIGGGASHECLKEIKLLMNAFNIRYKEVAEWEYQF